MSKRRGDIVLTLNPPLPLASLCSNFLLGNTYYAEEGSHRCSRSPMLLSRTKSWAYSRVMIERVAYVRCVEERGTEAA